MLPLPCVDCGHLVTHDHQWQVGHKPGHEQMHGAAPTLANVGPSHRKSQAWPRNCNQIAGGRMGATVRNAKRIKKNSEYPRW